MIFMTITGTLYLISYFPCFFSGIVTVGHTPFQEELFSASGVPFSAYSLLIQLFNFRSFKMLASPMYAPRTKTGIN